MKIMTVYSSLTGNTARLASYINEKLEENGNHMLDIFQAKDINTQTTIPDADLYIIAFWCRKSSMDNQSLLVLKKLSGKSVIAVGTIGGDAFGDYAKRVEETVDRLISERNRCIIVKVCQGSVNMEKIEKRRFLPIDNSHYVNEEKYRRHKSNIGRPYESDMEAVWNSILECHLRKSEGNQIGLTV